MKKEKMFTTDFYTIRFDLLKNRCVIVALESSKTLLEFGLDTAVDTLTTLDETTQITLTITQKKTMLPKLCSMWSVLLGKVKKSSLRCIPSTLPIMCRFLGMARRLQT